MMGQMSDVISHAPTFHSVVELNVESSQKYKNWHLFYEKKLSYDYQHEEMINGMEKEKKKDFVIA